MTRRRVTIIESPPIIVVRGWRASDLLREAGLKSTFSASAGGWMLDQPKLPDLLAFLQRRNIGATIESDPT
jgi:hypothetical protein